MLRSGDVHEDALHRCADALGHRLDDAQVRLVRHDEVDVFGRVTWRQARPRWRRPSRGPRAEDFLLEVQDVSP